MTRRHWMYDHEGACLGCAVILLAFALVLLGAVLGGVL